MSVAIYRHDSYFAFFYCLYLFVVGDRRKIELTTYIHVISPVVYCFHLLCLFVENVGKLIFAIDKHVSVVIVFI